MAEDVKKATDELIDFNKASKEQAENLVEIQRQAKESQISIGGYGDVLKKAEGIFSSFNSKLKDTINDLERSGKVADIGAARLLAFSLNVIKVKESFKGFGGIDSSSITTFSDSFDELKASLVGAPVSEVMDKLIEQAGKLNISQKLIDKTRGMGAKEGIALISGLIEQQTRLADNGMRLAAGYVHQMAATGNMSRLQQEAGKNFENLNVVMQEQATKLGYVGGAANKTKEEVEKAASSFGLISGAMHSVIDVAGDGKDKMDGLTATFKLADGTGRTFKETQDTISESQKAFTTTTKDAQAHMKDSLTLTAGLSELSGKLGVQYDIVKSGILSASSGLMEYTNAGEAAFTMTTGLRNITNEMAGGLMEAGMSGEKAMKTIGNYTKTIEGMSTAQKGFLSAQTGGPGGLQGAAQIENMIRKGDIEGVKKKVEETLKKQFGGKIVTTEDAAKDSTGQAAAQYNKQKMLLQQGPLGGMVKSDADAAQFLDMMKGKESGKKSDALSGNVLKNAIDAGSQWEKLTASGVSDGNAILTQIQLNTMGLALINTQNALATAATGDVSRQDNSENVRGLRENTSNNLNNNQFNGSNLAVAANLNANTGKQTKDTSHEHMAKGIIAAVKTLGTLPARVSQFKNATVKSASDTLSRDEGGPAAPQSPDRQDKSRAAQLALAAKNTAQPVARAAQVGAAPRAPTRHAAAGEQSAEPQAPHTVQVNKKAPGMNIVVNVDVSQASQQSGALNPPGGTHSN